MSDKIIEGEDLVKKRWSKAAIEDAEALEASLKALIDTFELLLDASKKAAKQSAEAFGNIDTTKAEGLAELNKVIKQNADAVKAVSEIEKKNAKAKKQLIELTDEEIKQKIINQKATKERKKLLEAELISEKKELKTIKDLQEANKALRISRDQLNIATEEGRKQARLFNNQIDANTEAIKENVDANQNLKIGIGGYEEAIDKALSKTEAFGGSLSNIGGELGKIGDGVSLVIQTLGTFQSFFKKKEKDDEKQLKQQKKSTKATEENTKAVKKNTKAAKENNEITKDITKSLKDQEDQAEETSDAADGAKKSFKGLALAGAAATGAAITAAFTQTREGGLALQKVIAVVTAVFGVLIKRLAESGNAILDYAKNFSTVGLSAQKFQLQLKKLVNVFDDVEEAKLDEQIKAINDQIEESAKKREQATARIQEAFEGTGKAIKDNIALNLENVEAQNELTNSTAKLTSSIADLQAKEQEQLAIEGDNTRGFEERNKAAIEAIRINDIRTRQQVELGKLELSIIKRTVDAELNALKISEDTTKLTTDQLLNRADLVNKVSAPSLEALAAANIELKEAEGERVESAIANSTILNTVIQDDVERRLDFSLDFVDNQLTINDRLIADDRLTLEERKKVLDENIKVSAEALEKQEELLNEFTEKINKDRAVPIDIDALIAIEDPQELADRIRDLGTSEIIEGRILEIIRDRRTQLQDIADAQREINELAQKDFEIKRDIVAQEKFLAELQDIEFNSIEEFEEKVADLEKQFADEQRDNEISSLKERIEAQEEGSEIRLDLQKELNALLIEQQLEANSTLIEEAEKTAEQQAEIDQKRIDRAKETLEALDQIAEQFFDKANERVDKQTDSIEKNQDRIRDLADKEGLEVDRNLASEERKLAEAQLKKEKLAKREAAVDIITEGIGLLGSKIEAGDKNPVLSTVTDIQLLTNVLKKLPLFFKGTEDTGKGGNMDANGGFMAMLHKREGVINAKDNIRRLNTGLSISETIDIAERFSSNGGHIPVETANIMMKPIVRNDNAQQNKEVVHALSKVVQATDRLTAKTERYKLEVDPILQLAKHTYESETKIETMNEKIGGTIKTLSTKR